MSEQAKALIENLKPDDALIVTVMDKEGFALIERNMTPDFVVKVIVALTSRYNDKDKDAVRSFLGTIHMLMESVIDTDFGRNR